MRGGIDLADLCREILGASPTRVELIGSSNNCCSFKIHVGKKIFKCYECLTSARAKLVQQISLSLREKGVAFPECIAVKNHIVFSEWIGGRQVRNHNRSDIIRRMAIYQAVVHKLEVPVSLGTTETMPHIEFLFDRLIHFGCTYIKKNIILKARDKIVFSRPRYAAKGILHSDFISTNFVVTAQDELVMIDNEFLSVGYGQEWDVLNTLRTSFGDNKKLHDQYLTAYARCGNLYTLISHRDYWENCYQIKIAGKYLSQGKIKEGLAWFELVGKKDAMI